ncbi:MAG: hypothetical protein DME23_21300, partial [Verrucomicrobia bacterium]
MANNLETEKKVLALSMLAEGNSIRSIERMTGVHRDTIMRLGIRVGRACERIMDTKMRNLTCGHIEVDEIGGFIGKKEKRATRKESMIIGVNVTAASRPVTAFVPVRMPDQFKSSGRKIGS